MSRAVPIREVAELLQKRDGLQALNGGFRLDVASTRCAITTMNRMHVSTRSRRNIGNLAFVPAAFVRRSKRKLIVELN